MSKAMNGKLISHQKKAAQCIIKQRLIFTTSLCTAFNRRAFIPMAQCAETALHSAQNRQFMTVSECSVEPFKTLSRPKDRPTKSLKSLRGSRGGER